MRTLAELDLFDPETIENPNEFYAAAREQAPVYQLPTSPIPDRRVFLVSTYDLIKVVHKDPETFSNRFAAFLSGDGTVVPEVEEITAQGHKPVPTLLTQDPPEHSRYRKIVSKAFNDRRVHKMEDYIRAICDELIDAIANKGQCDFLEEFAIPLPIFIIADQLGVPRSDMDKFKRWSNETVAGLSQMKGKESLIQAARADLQIQQYMAEIITQRRAEPQDDVISDLVNLTDDDGVNLTIGEILSIVKQMLVAGNETATNTLTSAMVHIINEPELQDRIATESGLAANVCEEVLRIEAPTKHMWRVVSRDTVLGNAELAEGDLLLLSYHSANHDTARYENGDEFQCPRRNAASHLSFGSGIHFCPGAVLARSQVRIAFEQLFSRLGNWQIITPPKRITHIQSILHRGLTELDLSFEQRAQ